jgi:peptidoglycan/LPS O-acetylase OafA/YrhL
MIMTNTITANLGRNCVAPFFTDAAKRAPGRILATAAVSTLLPYGIFRLPAWLGAGGDMHFYFGARSNPLVRIPTYLLGMQLGAATIQNKRNPIPFNWAAVADGLSLLVFFGYLGVTFLTEWTWDKEGRDIDLHLRGAVEFFATPIFAMWFRALAETDQSWSYKLLTLKPCMIIGEWSFCIYLSQFMVWGTTHLLLGRGGVTLLGAMASGSNAELPEWTRHLMVLQLVLVSGALFKLVEEPSRKYLNRRIDESWGTPATGPNQPSSPTVRQVSYVVGRAMPEQVCGQCGNVCAVDAKFCSKCGGMCAPRLQGLDSTAESTTTEYPTCGKCFVVSSYPNARFCCKCGATYV